LRGKPVVQTVAVKEHVASISHVRPLGSCIRACWTVAGQNADRHRGIAVFCCLNCFR